MVNHKYFCSLLVGKDQDILYEKYANDFTEKTPQTIMSITKIFVNLFIGELVEKKIISLKDKISKYLPNIGTGYAEATIQDVLDMNIENAYSEDYTDPFTSSYLHEPVCGWRLPKNLNEKIGQEEFLNKIESNKNKDLKNNTEFSHYKSANTDVIGLLIEKVSKKKLKDWVLDAVEAAGFEDALYMGTDRFGMPWISAASQPTNVSGVPWVHLFSTSNSGKFPFNHSTAPLNVVPNISLTTPITSSIFIIPS